MNSRNLHQYSDIIKFFFSLLAYISVVFLILLGGAGLYPFLVTIFVFLLYFLFFPKYILDPRNLVFAFFFLFLVVPMTVDYSFDYFNLDYQLPWGRPWNWRSLEDATYIEAVSLYVYMILFFSMFDPRYVETYDREFHVDNFWVCFVLVISILFMLSFIMKTGGIENWIFSYKETFLKGREGAGAINFAFIFSSNLSAFLLGLAFYKASGLKRAPILAISLLSIFCFAYFQGLKSRFIILSLVYFSPYLLSFRLTLFRAIVGGLVFSVLIFLFTYIRSNGFYSTPSIFLEYTMTYFNTFPLHDLVVKDEVYGLFSTMHYLLVKPASLVGLDIGSNFDLSVMLTKEFFPRDWETMKATQQWPLLTDLRYNYYGFLLGWLVILAYMSILIYLYKQSRRGHLAFLFIFMLELFRMFSVLRGTLIPWQFFVYIPMYLGSFIFLSACIHYRRHGDSRVE